MQKTFGAEADGQWGKNSIIALQKSLKVNQDGIMGGITVKAMQTWLNNKI